MSIQDILEGITLFKDLSGEEIGLIVPLVEEKEFGPGELIIEEGRPGRNFYIIAAGQVEIRKKIDDRKEKLLAALEEGTFFGEISLFDHGLRTATVKSVGDSTVLEIDGDRFNDLISSNPGVLRAMMEEMVYRLRQSNEIIRDFVIWAIYGKGKK